MHEKYENLRNIKAIVPHSSTPFVTIILYIKSINCFNSLKAKKEKQTEANVNILFLFFN